MRNDAMTLQFTDADFALALREQFVVDAEKYANALGSTLESLDSVHIQRYLDRVTPDNFKRMVVSLAEDCLIDD